MNSSAYKGLLKALLAIFVVITSLDVINATPLQYQYYLLNPNLSTGDLTVQSLSNDNKIAIGSSELVLDQYATGKIYVGPDLTQGAVITATGPFTLGSEVDATDLPVPGVFSGTSFVIPHYRDTHTYYLLSPNSDAQAVITIGGAATPVTLIKNQVFTFNAGSDNTVSGTIQSDHPILVSHVAGSAPSFIDAYPVAPASLEAWGVHSSNTIIGALEDNTTITVYVADNKSSRNNQSITYVLNAGESQAVTIPAGKGKAPDISQGQGNALHIVADKPVATIQVDDSDGSEATMFFDTPYLGMYHGLPVDSQYVSVVCTQADTTVTLHDGVSTPISETCSSDGMYGAKIYFGSPDNGVSFAAGSYIESNRPVYITYEAALQNDEHNSAGYKNNYFVLDAHTQNDPLTILSLENGNQIQGGALGAITLNELESLGSTGWGFSPGTEITGTGAFVVGSVADATDLLNPGEFAGTEFVIPHFRDTHTYYLLSPYGDSHATITIGASVTPVDLIKGEVFTFDAGSDNSISGIIESDRPILVSHVAGAPSFIDVYPVPPASLEAWGLRNSNAILGALEDNTTVTVYASDTQSTTYVLNAGSRQEITLGSNASQGKGTALHVVADKPISAIQADDSDGMDAAAFFDTSYLRSIYAFPREAEYIAVVCNEANTTVTLNSSKYGIKSVFTKTCDSDGVYPGKIYFDGPETYPSGPYFDSGSTIISDKGIYLTYDDASNNDERNLIGFNISLSGPQSPILYSLGEIIRDSNFTINGISQPNTTINVYVDGVAVTSVSADGTGIYSTNVVLSEGNHQIYTTQSDGANESNPSNAIDVSYVPNGRIEYYFLDPQTALSSLTFVSMVDNNQIFVGNTQYALDALQSVNISAKTLNRGDIVWGNGAFTVASEDNYTDTPTPSVLLGDQFTNPHVRGGHKYFLYSPEGDTSVTVTIGGGLPEVITVPANKVVIYDAGNTNNVSAAITSDRPIAVTHQGNIAGTALQDVYAVPPAGTELWGVKSANAYLSASQDNTTITVYSSDLAQTTYTLNKGETQAITIGSATADGDGAAIHVVSDKPVMAIQHDDSDGLESTAFWPSQYHRTEFVLPVDAQYIAVVCEQTDTVVTLSDANTSNHVQHTCSSTGQNPGKAYFGSTVDGVNITAKSVISADKPIHLYFETAANDDEYNLYGFNLAPAPGAVLTLNSPVSPTTQNPYEITGTATKVNALLDVYVDGVVQQQVVSGLDGSFSIDAYLNEGINNIYVTETDGVNITATSNTIQVQYDNTIDRNNLPSNITSDTVWTAGTSNDPYIIPATLTIASGASLILQPGVELKFESNARLDVNGSLVVNGTHQDPVLFTSAQITPAKNDWFGIEVQDGGDLNIDFAVIEYASIGIYFYEGSNGVVSNTIIQNNSIDGIRIVGASPSIGPDNTISLNGSWTSGSGIRLDEGSINPLPIIKNNKIFDNYYNIQTSSFAGGRNNIVDVRNNYWGSVNATEIITTIDGCVSNNDKPCVDFGDYLDFDGNVIAGPSLTGVFQSDTQLQPNTTYEVLGYVEVPAGVTLTLPAGTELVFVSLYQSLYVHGGLVSSGTQINPVIFTSGQTTPIEGARDIVGDWNGIRVVQDASLSMEYTVIKYADTGIQFSGSNVSGTVSNSVIEYAGTGMSFYSGASNINISNNLFQFNDTAIEITGSSSPIIGPENTIKKNNTGIFLRQLSNLNPAPTISGNYILQNTLYNINVNEFIGGNTVTVDVQGNYWGSDDPDAIALTMNQSSTSYPVIDYSNFILTADVPPGTGSNIANQELLTCPVVRVTDDSSYIDIHPQDNIEWIGNNFIDVQEIEKAFNNARSIDGSIYQYLKMPTQAEWDAMSVQLQGLYLINSERQARGIKPYEGISQEVIDVAQAYTDFVRTNNQVIGHYNDGKTPVERMDENITIRDNRDVSISPENGYEIHGDIPVPADSESVTRAIYNWIYYDKFPFGGGDAWGHRDSILQIALNENSGETYKEGLIGFGISSGVYNPDLATPAHNGAVVFINAFDPSASWDHNATQSVDTDSAQLCNDNVVISIDETSVPNINELKSLTISPTDIFLTPGATEQLQVIATYQDPLAPMDITTTANFIADNFSVINIDAGYITALRNGDVYAVASVNGITSNRVLITVRDKTDTSNLVGSYAENYVSHVPDNASIAAYDPKAFSVYTGHVKDRYDSPLSDVIVSIHNKPEYGSVKTDINGHFTFAAGAASQKLVYRKGGYLTIHRSASSASNEWAVVDDVVMLPVDTAETDIDLSLTTPQTHKSTVITDSFGSRSTTLVFDGITTATIASINGTQRTLSDFSVRATEYELPQSMPAALPKESAFTYCAELQIPGVRDDETVTFDNDVVMYVDNFLGFNVGEIVPVGYYDRQLGDWVASNNGIVVKLLDTDSNGTVDGLDISGDSIADDLNQNGSTADEVAGIENYPVGATYWRGAFNHFTPYDFNWPFVPPADATPPDNVTAESSNENKNQDELECTGSYVKPETLSFHEDIPITGTNLTLHYSSQRVAGYKHKFNIQVSGNTISPSMLEMIAKLEIGGKVFEQSFSPATNKEAEFIWDGTDPTGNRIEGVVNGLISIGYRYNNEYSSAGTATTAAEFASYAAAWAQVGLNATGVTGRDDFITWNTSPVSVQNTYENQLAEGWSISNHHLSSSIGNIYLGNGEVIDTNKTSLILKTGIQVSQHTGDDGFYQKGGNNIDYEVNRHGTLVDKVTGLEWQYTDDPAKFYTAGDAASYCSAALFTTDSTGWRLPTDKERTYTVDKSGAEHPVEIYNLQSFDNIWYSGFNNPDNKLLPVYCVRGETLDNQYVTDLKRDNTLEVVIDEANGLMWQDDATAVSNKLNWTDSIDYCEASTHAGYTDWRLPNINELAYTLPNSTFVNETTYTDPFWGPTAPNRNPYWSSTPYAGFSGYSWAMESAGFNSPIFNHTDLYNVRCVRDNIEHAPGPYRFDVNGRHINTVDSASGATLQTFAYDVDGTLRSITDRFGDAITITGTPDIDGFYQIITQDGYTTTVNINANNDVTSVKYDDNSQYSFTYGSGSLLESKTEPNGNIFTHVFDPLDGRVTQTSDQEGGAWSFFSNRTGNKSALYGYTTAELNTYQTLRTILTNGDVNKATTLFDGTVLTRLNQADDLKQTLQSCSATTIIDKVIDSKTKQPIPGTITITQPSGLQSTTNISKTYSANGADVTQQTVSTTQNGKTSSVFTDTKTGQTVLTSAENRTSTLNTDPSTLLLQSSQIPGLLDTTYSYDSRGRQESVTTGTRTTTFTYDPVGKGDVTTITADDGKQTHFEYDALGRVSAVIYPDTHRMENHYDDKGNLTTRVIPTPANHDFSYNMVNKVENQTRPKDGIISEVTQYDYDTERNLNQITLPSGKIISNTYINGLIDSTATPEGNINYSYTCNNKVASISEGTESINYTYDGSLLEDISYSGALNTSLSYGYNNDFNITSLNYAGAITSYGYDNDGLLTSANGYTITRNIANGLPEVLSNADLNQTRSYNGYGEAETVTTKVNNNTIYGYTLGYNDLGKITTRTETLDNGTVNTYIYSYDDRRRLDTVTMNGIIVEDYSYDKNGNRLTQTNDLRGISNQSANYNLGDQLISDGSTTYDYDADGYLKEKVATAGTTSYQYSSHGRLLQVVTPTETITYQHNAFGNRVAKLLDGVITEKYLWLDKTTLLATYDATGTLKQRFHYTDGHTPNSFTQSGQTYYIVTDHLGSPRAITDTNGTVLRKISYDSFGNIITDSNPALDIPFGFAGGLQDSDTGLIRFGYRDYDPETGRWTARDPIGFNGGDENLYGYISNNPINFIDSTGLAYFGKRPVGSTPSWLAKGPGTNSLDDSLNTELVHEQIFFEDGKFQSNLGFFSKGGIWNVPGGVGPDDPNRLGEYWRSDPRTYDDALMREAVRNVGDGNYCLLGSNCQDWAEKVRREYERLERARRGKCP